MERSQCDPRGTVIPASSIPALQNRKVTIKHLVDFFRVSEVAMFVSYTHDTIEVNALVAVSPNRFLTLKWLSL